MCIRDSAHTAQVCHRLQPCRQTDGPARKGWHCRAGAWVEAPRSPGGRRGGAGCQTAGAEGINRARDDVFDAFFLCHTVRLRQKNYFCTEAARAEARLRGRVVAPVAALSRCELVEPQSVRTSLRCLKTCLHSGLTNTVKCEASVQGAPRRGNEHIAQGIALGWYEAIRCAL